MPESPSAPWTPSPNTLNPGCKYACLQCGVGNLGHIADINPSPDAISPFIPNLDKLSDYYLIVKTKIGNAFYYQRIPLSSFDIKAPIQVTPDSEISLEGPDIKSVNTVIATSGYFYWEKLMLIKTK